MSGRGTYLFINTVESSQAIAGYRSGPRPRLPGKQASGCQNWARYTSLGQAPRNRLAPHRGPRHLSSPLLLGLVGYVLTFCSPSLNAGMTLEPPSDQAGGGAATTALGSVSRNAPSEPSRGTLPDICYTLRRKLNAFLDEQVEDEVLRNVQSQARVSMGVIDEALQTYGWVLLPSTSRC